MSIITLVGFEGKAVLEPSTMRAGDTKEGQRYILPSRFGHNVLAIQNGWNYNNQYILFLIEKGKERIIRTVMPEEEVIQPL